MWDLQIKCFPWDFSFLHNLNSVFLYHLNTYWAYNNFFDFFTSFCIIGVFFFSVTVCRIFDVFLFIYQGKQVDTDLSTQVRPSAQNLGLNQVDTNIPGSSSKSNNYFVPTRRIVPGRYNSDPFVSTQCTRYPLLPSERRYYSAICYIGNHNEWKK
jgi:hypothetical protein